MDKLTLIRNYIFYITVLPEILPLIFCILFYKKLNTKALKVFFIYSVVLAFFACLSLFGLSILKDRSLYLLVIRIFNIFEYSIIAFFLYQIIRSPVFRKLILFSIVPFIIFAVVDYWISDREQFNNHSNIISALLIIGYITFYFYEKMRSVAISPLYQSIIFWICVGLFFYFAGTFFFFLFINSSKDKEFIRLMNYIYVFVVITKNLILGLSLLASDTDETSDNDTLHFPTDLDLDELSPLSNPKN